MPEITRFFLIFITIYREVGVQHALPHLHARYQEHKASYSIVDPVERLAGELPRKQERLVFAWIEIHKAELLENWNLLAAGHPIKKVPPLT